MQSDSVKYIQPTPKPEISPKVIENLRKTGLNKQCFDCADKNTSFAVLDFGTFVCHQCALFHRELSHSVKDLGTSKFYDADQHVLSKYGNEKAKKLWMEKFDSKKEKIPKTKDSVGFKKYLSDKYLTKKYASKDLEKELNYLKIGKISPQPMPEPISRSDDSSTPKENANAAECNLAASNKEDMDKHKFEISEANVCHADDNTINYPKMSNFCHANLIEPSSPGVQSNILRENGQNNKNLFFFENFNTPCDNNVDLKDWGIIWENENNQKQESEKKLNEGVSDKEESPTPDKDNFNLLSDEKNYTTPKDWEFPMDFDMVNQNTHTTTSSSTSPDNMTSLSQNLNGIYNNYTNANTNSAGESKKTFDDLERYLCDPGFTTPANKKPTSMPLNVNQNIGMKNYSNMNMMGQTQNMPYNNSFPTMSPQMMMNYSYNINQINNNFQMQNQSGTDFARSTVQENSCSYNSNSTGTYRSNTPSGPAIENLSFNFNLLNVNSQGSTPQNTVGNTNAPTRTTPVKYDAFQDIYNYSKNTKSSSNKSSDTNVTSALKNGEQNNFNNKPLTIGFNSNNINNNLSNLFDF